MAKPRICRNSPPTSKDKLARDTLRVFIKSNSIPTSIFTVFYVFILMPTQAPECFTPSPSTSLNFCSRFCSRPASYIYGCQPIENYQVDPKIICLKLRT